MARKIIAAAIRERRVVNAADLLKLVVGTDVVPAVVGYQAADSGRGGHGARWYVYRPDMMTGTRSSSNWHGAMEFPVYGPEDKVARLAEAIAWTSTAYDIDPEGWERLPGRFHGGWYPTATLDAIEAALASQEG